MDNLIITTKTYCEKQKERIYASRLKRKANGIKQNSYLYEPENETKLEIVRERARIYSRLKHSQKVKAQQAIIISESLN